MIVLTSEAGNYHCSYLDRGCLGLGCMQWRQANAITGSCGRDQYQITATATASSPGVEGPMPAGWPDTDWIVEAKVLYPGWDFTAEILKARTHYANQERRDWRQVFFAWLRRAAEKAPGAQKALRAASMPKTIPNALPPPLEPLRKALGNDAIASWFSDANAVDRGDRVEIRVNSGFKLDYIRNNYKARVETALGKPVELVLC